MRIIVTGGAGFIGSALVRHLVLDRGDEVCTVDKLTYSGNLANLRDIANCSSHQFHQIDICDGPLMRTCMFDFAPDVVMHLAAESHVDRSIDGPSAFIETNIIGTYTLLELAREYVERHPDFRFHHISTDEVYGTLGSTGLFTEETAYQPNSPYSASKAASDHLARAWHSTYDLPVLVTNCSNNYGPFQYPEKLIPLVVNNAVHGHQVPVYGDGQQVRDWLYVEDHVRGLCQVVERGKIGQTYNLGGGCDLTNLRVIETILDAVAQQTGQDPLALRSLISFVEDRPGHDRRYAIDASKIRDELGWVPTTDFKTGIARTVQWYLDNEAWCAEVSAEYGGERLGLVQGK